MKRVRRRRRRLLPAQRRQQLLEVGLELLDRDPSRGPSSREVAQRAEIAPGLLYRYFPDQRAFHLALLAESAERLSTSARLPQLPFEEALRASLQAQVQFARRHGGLWRALRTAPAALRERLQEDQLERVMRGLGGAPGSARTRILLRGWLGFCDGAIEAWLDRGEIAPSELVSILVSALEPALAAFRSPPPRPRSHKPRVRLVGAARPAAP